MVCWAFWVQAGQLPDLSLHRHSDFLGWQVRLVRHNLQFSFLWINQSFQSLHYLYGQFFLPSLFWILLLRRLHEHWSFGGRLWSSQRPPVFISDPKRNRDKSKAKAPWVLCPSGRRGCRLGDLLLWHLNGPDKPEDPEGNWQRSVNSHNVESCDKNPRETCFWI